MTTRALTSYALALLIVACVEPAFRLTVTFPGPVEVETGAEVRYQGVWVGSVSEIALRQPSATEPALVEISLEIDDAELTLREADVFEIVSDGLLGDSYVRITPAPEASPALAPGATVAGLSPLATRVRESAADALEALAELAKQKLGSVGDEAEEPPVAE